MSAHTDDLHAVTIVATLMVRDEVDIIVAMVEHHLAQGVDLVIATDNGSIDGTREILAEYADRGVVELHDYLVHDKNQGRLVSSMAERAFTEHGADWVINADADEFFVPVDRTKTLRDVLEVIPKELGSFSAAVTNLTGAPAPSGTGLSRLSWRDVRAEETLMETVALHAHPTSVAIHVGAAQVTVRQGNHGVSIPSTGRPDDALAIEVLHLPWRSYRQYASKIDNTGRAYESNPALNPSPRHHGMRDFRFQRAGVLEDLYIVRHRLADDAEGFVEDRWLAESLAARLDSGQAVLPERLAELVADEGEPYDVARIERAQTVAGIVIPLEIEHIAASTQWLDAFRNEQAKTRHLREKASALEQKASALEKKVAALQKKVKAANSKLAAAQASPPSVPARVRRRLGRVMRRLMRHSSS